ncbi:MAG: type II secretion system minor pseudopilin GspK [Gammaproteobacteria bacterium]|nr:type II secretion system minor pseudopilin GspK [Gammaproteobacteria bacterium]
MALVTALLVVSLATVAAVAMATRQHIDVRRTGNLVHGEQAYAYALAAESWARVTLRKDARESNYDALDEDWATALPPIAVEGGLVSGRVDDLQGRFNLNNLVGEDGKASDADQAYFTRLLDLLGLELSLADTLTDWIDADIDARFPDGAEDEHYLLNEPAYRPANRPLASVSELRLVKGFDAEALQLLIPHVTALPGRTLINVNTATAVVLQALHSELDASAVEMLLADREDTGYQSTDDFLGHAALAGLELDTAVDVNSEYFRILTDVVVGQGQARLESLLSRTDGETRIIYRLRTSIRSAPQIEAVID